MAGHKPFAQIKEDAQKKRLREEEDWARGRATLQEMVSYCLNDQCHDGIVDIKPYATPQAQVCRVCQGNAYVKLSVSDDGWVTFVPSSYKEFREYHWSKNGGE